MQERAVSHALLAILMFGTTGALFELLLLGHVEDAWQFVPVVLLGLGLLAAALPGVRRGTAFRRPLRLLYALYVGSGILGFVLHMRANAAFEKERDASLATLPLFWESLRGATPAMAPALMMLLGFLGLLYVYQSSVSSGDGGE